MQSGWYKTITLADSLFLALILTQKRTQHDPWYGLTQPIC